MGRSEMLQLNKKAFSRWLSEMKQEKPVKVDQVNQGHPIPTITTAMPSSIFNAQVHLMHALYNKRMQSDKLLRCAPQFAADAKRYNARESGVGGNRGDESKSAIVSGI